MKTPPAKIRSWKDFADAIRNARQKEGWSQEVLAKKISVSQPLVCRVERGDPISDINVTRIAKELKLDVSALVKSQTRPSARKLAYCAFTRCPSLSFAAIEGELFIAPRFVPVATTESCSDCGIPLQQECPECSAPITKSALRCSKCNCRYVQVPEGLAGLPQIELENECDKRNLANKELRRNLDME